MAAHHRGDERDEHEAGGEDDGDEDGRALALAVHGQADVEEDGCSSPHDIGLEEDLDGLQEGDAEDDAEDDPAVERVLGLPVRLVFSASLAVVAVISRERRRGYRREGQRGGEREKRGNEVSAEVSLSAPMRVARAQRRDSLESQESTLPDVNLE